MIRVIAGRNKDAALFFKKYYRPARPIEMWGPFEGLIIERNGKYVAAVIFDSYRGFDCNISVASCDPRWCSRKVLRAIAAAAFYRLKVKRLTALVRRRDMKTRSILQRIGFVEEGKKRKGFDGYQDQMQYGLLRSECKWLR